MCFYCPPTKLREGDVFSRVCLSVHRGRSYVTITHDALDLTPPPPRYVPTCSTWTWLYNTHLPPPGLVQLWPYCTGPRPLHWIGPTPTPPLHSPSPPGTGTPPSQRFAFYWNAFMLLPKLCSCHKSCNQFSSHPVKNFTNDIRQPQRRNFSRRKEI